MRFAYPSVNRAYLPVARSAFALQDVDDIRVLHARCDEVKTIAILSRLTDSYTHKRKQTVTLQCLP